MGKMTSLLELARRGLNTPELLLEIKQFDTNKLDKWTEFYAKATGRVSIRTQRDGEVVCPFLPNITIKKAAQQVPSLIRSGYSILCFKAIDPKDSIFCGNFADTGKKYVVEWIAGPGTCRDLEKARKINHFSIDPTKKISHIQIPQPAGDIIGMLVPTCRNNELIEWSIYPYKIGQLKDTIIFWEIRPWR